MLKRISFTLNAWLLGIEMMAKEGKFGTNICLKRPIWAQSNNPVCCWMQLNSTLFLMNRVGNKRTSNFLSWQFISFKVTDNLDLREILRKSTETLVITWTVSSFNLLWNPPEVCELKRIFSAWLSSSSSSSLLSSSERLVVQ